MEKFQELVGWLNRVDVRPVWVCVVAVFNWLICPNAAYAPAIAAVWIAVFLDIFTRLYAQSKKAGGFFKAIRNGTISSDTMWIRTKDKVIFYIVIQILTGLSMKIDLLGYVGMATFTFVYSFLFLREFISNLENMIDAGADYFKPLLCWMRKKEETITKEQKDENKRSS